MNKGKERMKESKILKKNETSKVTKQDRFVIKMDWHDIVLVRTYVRTVQYYTDNEWNLNELLFTTMKVNTIQFNIVTYTVQYSTAQYN